MLLCKHRDKEQVHSNLLFAGFTGLGFKVSLVVITHRHENMVYF